MLHLCLEGTSPRDAIFLLLLYMLTRHVSCIIKQSDVPLHNVLTVLTGIDYCVRIDAVVFDVTSAHCFFEFKTEELFGLIVFLVHHALFGGVRYVDQLRLD